MKSMTVPMVQIGIVRMRMDQRFVRMLRIPLNVATDSGVKAAT